jgi:hypothetical protein
MNLGPSPFSRHRLSEWNEQRRSAAASLTVSSWSSSGSLSLVMSVFAAVFFRIEAVLFKGQLRFSLVR